MLIRRIHRHASSKGVNLRELSAGIDDASADACDALLTTNGFVAQASPPLEPSLRPCDRAKAKRPAF